MAFSTSQTLLSLGTSPDEASGQGLAGPARQQSMLTDGIPEASRLDPCSDLFSVAVTEKADGPMEHIPSCNAQTFHQVTQCQSIPQRPESCVTL